MKTTRAPQKKRGPVPLGHIDTHVLLPPADLEWAKQQAAQQEESLSSFIRNVLRAERARRAASTPTP